jgi:GTP-binding protein LepA
MSDEHIRNFSIVAHIDHGKSTLADRLIERAGIIEERMQRAQMMDELDIERERGITIKSNTITLPYVSEDGARYKLNLIDTPGHVDFSYEVSRSLSACEGVLLLVDASQGVEAQTMAHLYTAMEHDLAIVPVINKIDLPSAEIERVKVEIQTELGLNPDEVVCCSARTGEGIDEIFRAICERVPAPGVDREAPLRALIYDARYDAYRGTVVACRVMEGCLRAGDRARLINSGTEHRVEEVGTFRLGRMRAEVLEAGDVGYVLAGIKTVRDVAIGDTLTNAERPATEPLEGFLQVKPVVFASIYPIEADEYSGLVDALERYQLNDAALEYTKDSSAALGQGFRCGFLGLLHLEIVQERLEREFDQAIIMTMPSVRYRFTMKDGSQIEVDNPAHFPEPVKIQGSEEPYVRISIILPERYLGSIMNLCRERRGENPTFDYAAPGRVELRSDIPLAEVIYDFYDRLKSLTQGYGSFDYEPQGYRKSELVKLDILVNGEPVDALASMIHRDNARRRGLQICNRLKDEIPRQMFRVAIQGAIGGTIVARSTIQAFRKDVTAKCYGGDISRKRKLLEKQKAGKKRMKMVGSVQIPQKAFVSVLKTNDD